MDLIQLSVNLINDVQKLRQDYRSGKISLETYSNELDGICQIEKLANVMIKTRITEERFKKPIYDSQKVIIMESPESQKIKCPGNNRTIKRSTCLDWSGENPPKFEDCLACDEFVATRNLLLPEKDGSG